jgi:hypothetical protein
MNWKFWKKERGVSRAEMQEALEAFYKVNRNQFSAKYLLDNSVLYNPVVVELTDYQRAARLEYRYFKTMALNKTQKSDLPLISQRLANSVGGRSEIQRIAQRENLLNAGWVNFSNGAHQSKPLHE